MANARYSSMQKTLEKMQAKLQLEKDEKARVLGDAIMDLYGGVLLDYGKADLRAVAKHLDIQEAVREMENEKAMKPAGMKPEEKLTSGFAGNFA